MANTSTLSANTEAAKYIRERAAGRVYLTAEDLSALTGDSPKTIFNQVSLGTYFIPSIRRSKRRLWHIDDVLSQLSTRAPL